MLELHTVLPENSCRIIDHAERIDGTCKAKFDRKATQNATPIFVKNQATGKTQIVYVSLKLKLNQFWRVLTNEIGEQRSLLLYQGRPLRGGTLEDARISANSTLIISSPPLIGGVEADDDFQRSVEGSVQVTVESQEAVIADVTDNRKHIMTVYQATEVTQHKLIANLSRNLSQSSLILQSDKDPKIAFVEIALGNSLAWLKESTYKNQSEFIKNHDRIRKNLKVLTNYVLQQKPNIIQEFSNLPKHLMSLENFIGKLDFQDAFKFFISLQPEYLCVGESSGTDDGLTADQRTLLQFIRSFRGYEISNLFAKIFQEKTLDNSNLEKFTKNLQKDFQNRKSEQKKLDLICQTTSDRLKLILFNSYSLQEKIKLYRMIKPSVNNTFFTLLALCSDETIDEWVRAINDTKTKHEFEAWKAIYQATGESPKINYSSLESDAWKISKRYGLQNFQFQDVIEDDNREKNKDEINRSKHISVGLQRVIDMPNEEEILDQFTRFRNEETEIVRLLYSKQRADAAFTIDQFFMIQESRDLNEGFHLQIVQCARQDQKSKVLSSISINQPLKFNDCCSDSNDDTYLFYGSLGEVFWFCRDKSKGVILNLLEADSIEVVQHEINKDSELCKHILENRFSKVHGKSLYYYATAVPRLITFGDMQLVTFSQHSQNMPSVQFYDLVKGIEIVRVQNAEMFLHYISHEPGSRDVHQILFKADPFVCSYQNEIMITFDQRIAKLSDLIQNNGPSYQDMKLIRINFTEARESAEAQLYDLGDESIAVQASIGQVSSDQRKSVLSNELDPKKRAVKVVSSASCNQIQQFAISYEQELIMFQIEQSRDLAVNIVPSPINVADFEGTKVQNRIIAQKDGSINLVMFKCESYNKQEIQTQLLCVHYQSKTSLNKKLVLFRRNIKQHRSYLLSAQEVDDCVFNVDLIDESKWLKELQIYPDDQSEKYEQRDSIKIAQTFVSDVRAFRNNQKFAVSILSKEPLRNWRVTVDHPLVLFYNIERRNEFFVYSLVEQGQDLVLFRFDDWKIILTEQTQGCMQSPESEFVILGQNNEDKLFTLNLLMTRPFEKEALCSYSCWYIEKNEPLNTPFPTSKIQKAILQDKIQMKKIFLFQGGNPKLTAVVCIGIIGDNAVMRLILQNAPTRFDQKRPAELSIVNNKTARLIEIYPVRCQNGIIYFIEQDLKTQKYHLVELELTFSEVYQRWDHNTKRVFGTYQKLCQIQLVRDNDQKQDYDYNYDGCLNIESVKDYYVDENTQLFLLQADLVKLIKIQRNKELDKFQVETEIGLNEVEGLADQVQLHKPSFLSMSISDRAIVISDQAFVIKSGQQHQIFQSDQPQFQQFHHQTSPVPQSDYLMTRRTSKDSSQNSYLSFIFENDPSRRNRSIIGVRHLRNLISMHIISPKLMLARFGKSYNTQYWSLLTYNGRVAEIGYDLLTKLNSQKWHRVQTCFIKGRICKILLTFKDKDETFVEILEVSNTGELIRSTKHDFVTKMPKPQYKEVFMNWKGELLEVHIQKITKQIFEQVKLVKNEEKQLVTITTAQPGTYFVYTGNYLCWLAPEELHIRFVPIGDFDAGIQTIPLQDTFFKQISQISEAEIKEKIKETPIIMDSIEPFVAAKCEVSGKLDPETLAKHSDRLQVMICDKVKIFNLSKKEDDNETQNHYEVAEELLATESLLEPQLYVSTEHVCATVTKRSKSIFQEYFKVTQQGYMVIHMQSKKFSEDLSAQNGSAVRHRKVLGIYAEFAAIDIFEIKRLEECCDKKIQPAKIDTDTFTASFGLETTFTLLPTIKMKRDPEILQSIYNVLQELQLEEVDDAEGFKVINPFYRRIRDILIKNVFISHQRQKEGDQLEYMVCNCLMQASQELFAIRDKLLDIGNSLGCFSFIQVLSDQRDFDQYLYKCTPSVINSLNNCYEDTQSTKAITSLQVSWPEDTPIIVYKSNSYAVDHDKLTEFVQKNQQSDEGSRLQAVSVQQIPVEWFIQNGSFLDFTMKLNNSTMPDELYQTEFVKAILEVYWNDVKKAIVIWRVLPYVFLTVIQMWHMFGTLSYSDMEEKKANKNFYTEILNIACIVLVSLIVYFEVQQLRDKRSQYFSTWNINDWATILLSFFVNFSLLVGSDLVSFQTLRIFASLVSLTLMIKIFDWLRIFDVTAFSVQLILATIWDIKFFILIFLYALIAFGIPMMFIELQWSHSAHESNFWYEVFNYGLYTQYLISLGEFNFDSWGDDQICKIFMTIYFVCATFFTQITMLNMLIAIMGETFSNVFAKQEINSMKTKIGFISEIERSFIETTGRQKENETSFIYVIKPAFGQQNQDNDLQEQAISLLNKIDEAVDKRTRDLKTDVHCFSKEFNRRIDSQDAKLAEIMGCLKEIQAQSPNKDDKSNPKHSLTSIVEMAEPDLDDGDSVDLSEMSNKEDDLSD